MTKVNLIEILHPKMDVLFVALNPPETSNSNGHYFSRNLSFWNLLFYSGLITQKVSSPLMGDDEVFRKSSINYKKQIFGITDLCHDVVQTNSSRVHVKQERVGRILNLLQNYSVKHLCLIHSNVGKAFRNIPTLNRKQSYGLIGKINSTFIFELPFHNASIANKHLHYKKLTSYL